jgi:hypothetical protein
VTEIDGHWLACFASRGSLQLMLEDLNLAPFWSVPDYFFLTPVATSEHQLRPLG